MSSSSISKLAGVQLGSMGSSNVNRYWLGRCPLDFAKALNNFANGSAWKNMQQNLIVSTFSIRAYFRFVMLHAHSQTKHGLVEILRRQHKVVIGLRI